MDFPNLKVGKGECLIANTKSWAEDFKEHAKFKNLPWAAALAAAEKALTDVDEHVKQVDNASLPFMVTEAAAKMGTLLDTLEDKMKEVRRYRQGLRSLRMEKAVQVLENKRCWRTGRDQFQRVLRKKQNAKALAKLFADNLQARVLAPSQACLNLTFKERLEDGNGVTRDYFDETKLVKADSETFFGTEVRDFLSANKAAATAAKNAVIKSMKQEGRSSGILDFTAQAKFKWTRASADQTALFPDACEIKPFVGNGRAHVRLAAPGVLVDTRYQGHRVELFREPHDSRPWFRGFAGASGPGGMA